MPCNSCRKMVQCIYPKKQEVKTMFNNPGAKIKGLANVFFWIMVVCFVLVVLAMGDYLFEETAGLIASVLILAIGAVFSYISSLFIHSYIFQIFIPIILLYM